MFKCLIYSQLAQCRLSEEKKCGIDCFIILRFNDFLSFMVCFVCVCVAVPSFNARVCVCVFARMDRTDESEAVLSTPKGHHLAQKRLVLLTTECIQFQSLTHLS